jgi:YVTN family beta-propeller protein
MRRGWQIGFAAALCALAALAAVPAVAGARTAYVAGFSQEEFSGGFAARAIGFGGGAVAPVNLATETTGEENEVDFPEAIAISPDGKTAYLVVEAFDGEEFTGYVQPIDVATNALGTPIKVGDGADAIAISPDGSHAYVTNRNDESVSVIDLATQAVTATIEEVAENATGIAVTPDGTRAYVTDWENDEVQVIDLSTNTLGPRIPVGSEPSAIAMTPDGTRAYVTDEGSDDVLRITLATNAVGSPIEVEDGPEAIAITPDSKRAYVLSFFNPVTAVDLDTDTPIGPIEVEEEFLEGIAILPDGSRAYVTAGDNELHPIDIPADTLGTTFPTVPNPGPIAIVPNQPPQAAFTPSPSSTKPGTAVQFDATASQDTDGGTVARYDWNFGDGTELPNGGPTPTHTFSKEGTYTVTLTTTDNEGCSLDKVFPGQTMYCNGSSIARTTRQVTVATQCPKAVASADSFVPKFRSAHVVPGLRVRLSVNTDSRLDVKGTVHWSGNGHKRSYQLEGHSFEVKNFRRIRYVIPGKLRDELPLGTPVSVKLKIHATPLEGNACAGSATNRTLHLKVVKVIPGAVQKGRRK